MALYKLPDELKIEVFRNLDSIDLAQVALSCRNFYNHAIPFLYSSFSCRPINYSNNTKTPDFLSTILSRPNLAAYVRHLTGFDHVSDDFSLDKKDELGHKIQAAINEVCESNELREEWYLEFFYSPHGKYRDGNWDAITALLILLLPNLSSIRFPSWPGEFSQDDEDVDAEHPRILPAVFARATELQRLGDKSAGSLKNLRNIEVLFDSVTSHNPILPVLQLPSLRHVTCFYYCPLEEEHMYRPQRDWEPFSHITHLSIPHSEVESSELVRFIKRFNQLTHFSYIHQQLDQTAVFPLSSVIRDGLIHLQDSLEELTLLSSTENAMADSMRPQIRLDIMDNLTWPQKPLGSLVGFRKLCRLHITMLLLVGQNIQLSTPDVAAASDTAIHAQQSLQVVQSFPNCLEEISLRACVNHVGLLIDHLLERRRKGELNKMKKVVLSFVKELEEYERLDFVRREKEAEEVGIELTWNTSEFPPNTILY